MTDARAGDGAGDPPLLSAAMVPGEPIAAAEAIAGSAAGRARDRYERQRQRILDAATLLLNERGVRGMTFREVARASSLKTTSVVYYFRYKELLAAAVFEDSLGRLRAIVREAGAALTPRDRVARYLELYFAQFARSLRGEARPLAILSDIRALDDAHRTTLIVQYQAIFREVRAFFGGCDDPARKLLLTARTQLLNEALFWSATWLGTYAIGDFDNVRGRLFDILEQGIAAPGARRAAPPAMTVASDGPLPARAAFLRAATRLINECGYKGASVDRIMRELHLSKGSFYHHVDAKDDLILECFRESYRRLARIQSQTDAAGGTRWERLVAAVAAVLSLQFAGDQPLLRSTALQAMPAGLRDHALGLSEREALWLTGVLVDGMKEGSVRIIDPLVAGQIIMSTINSAYDIRAWAARQPLPDAVARYASLLTGGIFD